MRYGPPPRIWPAAVLTVMLCACSATPRVALPQISPPPPELTDPCPTPQPLPDDATARDLAAWTVEWIEAYWCASGRQAGLVRAWPK